MHTRPTDFANHDTALVALTSYEANDIAASSRKNPLEAWRRLQKRPDSTAGGRKRNHLRTIVSPARCSLLELQAGMDRWESAVSQYEEKSKNKMNDEIKLAGLEALVPKELEKHLILNSKRLRTFEDARGEAVWFFKFVISSRVTRACVNIQRLERSTLSLVSRRRNAIRFAQWVF